MSSEVLTQADLEAILNNLFSSIPPNMIDFFYPVGSYYETSLPNTIPSGSLTPTQTDIEELRDTWFDPNYAFTGTWVLETPGQVHVSAGTGYSVSGALTNTSDGGSEDAVIPIHTHTLTRSTDVAVDAHGITQPAFTVTGGGVTNGITSSGAHQHNQQGWLGAAAGSKEMRARKTISGDPTETGAILSSGAHVHSLPSHTHTVTRSTDVALSNNHSVTQPVFVAEDTGVSAVGANMQPHINVYRWHRTL